VVVYQILQGRASALSASSGDSQARLEKYEIRISKSETNLKLEYQNFQNRKNKVLESFYKTDQIT